MYSIIRHIEPVVERQAKKIKVILLYHNSFKLSLKMS